MTDDDGPGSSTGPSAGCCRMSAPDEAAPSLTSAAAPALAVPSATAVELALPVPPGCLEAHARLVSPRARAAPLYVLYSVLLV
jgi:hypothetical protein